MSAPAPYIGLAEIATRDLDPVARLVLDRGSMAHVNIAVRAMQELAVRLRREPGAYRPVIDDLRLDVRGGEQGSGLDGDAMRRLFQHIERFAPYITDIAVMRAKAPRPVGHQVERMECFAAQQFARRLRRGKSLRQQGRAGRDAGQRYSARIMSGKKRSGERQISKVATRRMNAAVKRDRSPIQLESDSVRRGVPRGSVRAVHRARFLR